MSWTSIADLLANDPAAPVALLGAPLEAGSVTPGRCDLAPGVVRTAMKRISTYDLVEALELDMAVHDAGDVAVRGLMPADGFEPIRDALAALTGRHALTLLIGGNNAVTRPAAHGLGAPLADVGLITLDAHFDMRETDEGPRNGNPVRCLLEDGLPGANICQIGLAPFANTRKMHEDALAAGIGVFDLEFVLAEGIEAAIDDALERLSHVEAILVDFDIDVIDRGQFPGAPGARPGGLPVWDFFRAARRLAEEERVRAVDLTEFDPGLDASDLSGLTAARWVAEILAGFSRR
ncbi:MAG TPA: arginase family protein [Allosphingosinicella sp.]|nr:arginase family protein [Allosphingosinicella sp.]